MKPPAQRSLRPDDHVTVVTTPPRGTDRWALTSPDFEVAWPEVLGPTATLVARRLGRMVEQPGSEVRAFSLGEMGHSLGVSPGKIRDALFRLEHHGIVDVDEPTRTVRLSGNAPQVPPAQAPPTGRPVK